MANPNAGSPRFVLSSIEPQGGARSRSTVTGYTLTPSAAVSLSEHLNHRVQITGTVDTATTPSPTSTQPSSPNSSSAMPRCASRR